MLRALLKKGADEMASAAARSAMTAELREISSRIIALSEREGWSARETARRLRMPLGSWYCASAGRGNPATYLPALRAAAERLGA